MKYPFIKQEGLKDCAVASLGMIIKYHKGYISQEQLRDMLETNKEGTSALAIMNVAEYIGFNTKALKTNDLTKLQLPCIAYVTIAGKFKHFLVIYEIDFKKETVLVGDPASTIHKIKMAEFAKITNNIYLTFVKTKTIPYFKYNSIFTFLLTFLKSNKKTIFRITIISLITNLLIILNSFSFNILINTLNNNISLKTIILLLLIMVIFVKAFSIYLRNILTICLNEHVSYDLTCEIYSKIIHFPYIYYCNRTTGEIIARLTDLEHVKSLLSKITIILFTNIPLIIGSLIVMASLNFELTIYALCSFMLYAIIVIVFMRLYKLDTHECQRLKEESTSYLVESIGAYECVKGLTIETNVINKYKSLYYKFLVKLTHFFRKVNFENLLKDLLNEITFILIIYKGIIAIETNDLSLASLITFTFLLSNFSNSLKEILDAAPEITESLNALKRILELDYEEKVDGKIEKILDYDIEIKNLNYAYNDNEILKNVNLVIKEGAHILIMGPSGEGKSTLLKILKSYLKVKNNMVKIGKIDLNEYSKKAFNDVVYIAQNEMLFTDTLYENIALGRDYTANEVLNVAHMCHVKENELGLNMVIEENGFNLSGGEKERVILARTLLARSKIALIDEATSQLDVKLEREILKSILKNYGHKTIIVVAHRQNNADLFDQVYQIEKGEISLVNP